MISIIQRVRVLVKALLVSGVLGALVQPAAAEGPGWSGYVTVKKLVVTANGGVNVQVSPNLTSCVSQSGYGPAFASVYPTHPGINRIKADLTVAFVTGTPVSLYFSDSTCTVTEMQLGAPQ